jgi:hypothetical protein
MLIALGLMLAFLTAPAPVSVRAQELSLEV